MEIPDYLNVQTPLFSVRARGQWKKQKIFQVIKGKQALRNYSNYDGSAKPQLVTFQPDFAAAVYIWQHLDYSERRWYIHRAAKLGLRISGYNYFISLFVQGKTGDRYMGIIDDLITERLAALFPHHTRHEDAGDDEISITDLEGKSTELKALELLFASLYRTLLPIPLTDFGGVGRDSAVAVESGGKIYVGLGTDGTTKLKDWWEYDPGINVWTQKTDFGGTARWGAVAASSGGKIYVGTGLAAAITKDWWEYDPVADTWASKTDLSGNARWLAVAAVSGGKVYVGTGYDGSNLKDWWEYDPVADSWTSKTDFSGTARRSAMAAVSGGKVYVGTGLTAGNQKDWFEYDPDTNTWAQQVDFGGIARWSGVAAMVNQRIYAGTGFTAGGRETDWWLQTWEP